jgi:ketosteroid isomerase-like protein
MLSYSQLLSSATTFCDAFAQKKDLDSLLSLFSSTGHVSAIEHGEKALSPFFGRTHEGLDKIRSYFESIPALLGYERMSFSEFTVDTEENRVACKGQAHFIWNKTGENWDEIFACIMDFDDEGKITRYQAWPDSGSLYLAKLGKLSEVSAGARDSGTSASSVESASPATLSRSQLLSSATTFCNAFVQKQDLDTILSFFSSTGPVSIIEHGEKALTPFFGRSFEGLDEIRSFHEGAGTHIEFEETSLARYTVDAEAKRVACEGQTKLSWRETGEGWVEIFVFMLDFDDEGKVTKHQIWSDTGSAYLAKLGTLSKIRAEAD